MALVDPILGAQEHDSVTTSKGATTAWVVAVRVDNNAPLPPHLGSECTTAKLAAERRDFHYVITPKI